MGELLEALRGEFALDLPATEQTLAAWQAQPAHPPETLPQMLGFMQRLSQTVQIVGLHGLSDFLQQVHDFAERLGQAGVSDAPSPSAQAALAWLCQWPRHAQAYLERPAQSDVVQALSLYYSHCPDAPSLVRVSQLATLLAVAPEMPAEEAADEPLARATAADTSLAMDDVDASLLDALLADAPEQLERLEATLAQWRQGQASEAPLQEALRIAHTFKGSGSIIGLPGIGRMAHRLEDLLEYVLDQVRQGHAAHPAMARDSMQAVHCLQQMVSHLQGQEAAPLDAQAVLQRLIDWVQWIRDGAVASAAPIESAPDSIAETIDSTLAAPVQSPESSPAPGPAPAPAHAAEAPASDSANLRVSVERMSRLLRRAGQSIVHSQRLAQLLQDASERIEAATRNQAELNARLRALETLVDGQALALREQQKDGELDPLELDRYDALHVVSRAIAEAAQDGQELVQSLRQDTEHASALLRDEGYALIEQHRELLQARLVPAKTVLPRLRRNVAQTASATGKDVAFSVQGDAVTLDADVLTRLTEPLLHLLRNAVDHGIESAAQRRALGKSAQGHIAVRFARVGQEVEIVVSDDGRGLDLPAIADKARAFGLLAQDAQPSDAELRRLILHPGFSTRDRVTEISGRGVGMDVVNDRIAALKGRLAIDSSPQQGSRFTLHVPASGGVAQALIVRCADEAIALAADQVQGVLYAGQATLVSEHGAWWAVQGSGDDTLRSPAFQLGQWLGFDDAALGDSPRPIVLAKGVDGPIALLVDAVLDTRELILQDIGQLTRRIRGVVAGALRPDGKPLFLIDVVELERATRSATRMAPSAALRRRQTAPRKRILVVDDALSVRRSMQQLLHDAGYDVVLAGDGFEAIEQLRQQRPSIILTDLEMPNLNGLELTRRVRELPLWADLPVVLITSRAGDKHRALASEAGVNVYLTKPYQDADLLAHVRQLTQQADSLDLAL